MSAFKTEAVSGKGERGVALVTGASTGIGRATAKALKDAGFRVFGTSRRPLGRSRPWSPGAHKRLLLALVTRAAQLQSSGLSS
jgi:NAD(P)-dependent dehydrogenase (short-subunit alcohol dehydrogenase family)